MLVGNSLNICVGTGSQISTTLVKREVETSLQRGYRLWRAYVENGGSRGEFFSEKFGHCDQWIQLQQQQHHNQLGLGWWFANFLVNFVGLYQICSKIYNMRTFYLASSQKGERAKKIVVGQSLHKNYQAKVCNYRVSKMDWGHFKELMCLCFWCQAYFPHNFYGGKCVHFILGIKNLAQFG